MSNSEIVVDISVAHEIAATLSDSDVFAADIGSALIYQRYEGETEITPNDNAQVLNTAGKYIHDNIAINRIPQTEYAHITYDQNQDIRVW